MSIQLNDLRSYSRHWLGEFIDLYRVEECLWQPKHPDYSNHNARNRAYDKLVEKLKEVEPHPDRPMVVRKINSLRSAFRREFRKYSSKSNYETRLWYYEKLLFIADQNPKRLSNSLSDSKPPKRALQLQFDEEESLEFENEDHLEAATSNSQIDGTSNAQTETIGSLTMTTGPGSAGECVTLVKSEEPQQHQSQHVQHQVHHLQTHQTHAPQPQPQHTTTAVKVLEITSLDSNSQREIQQAVKSLEHQHQIQQLQQQQSAQTETAQITQIHQQVPTIQISREHLQPLFSNSYSTTGPATTQRHEDEYDAIGINVASKLRVMNPTQRIIAEKLISDVLFNGQLDNLSINSSLTQ